MVEIEDMVGETVAWELVTQLYVRSVYIINNIRVYLCMPYIFCIIPFRAVSSGWRAVLRFAPAG